MSRWSDLTSRPQGRAKGSVLPARLNEGLMPNQHTGPRPLAERFWEKVQVVGLDECWLWIGSQSSLGYGRIQIDGHVCLASRISWELLHGPPAVGQCVLHHCDNPSCVNPRHLFLGDRRDNARDAIRKGRFRFAVIPRGELNWASRLTNNMVREIRSMKQVTCCTNTSLAARYGVSISTIGRIINHNTWTHI